MSLCTYFAVAAIAVLSVDGRSSVYPPPRPTQYPAFYEEKFFEQRADHFNSMNKDTFQHRYLLNDTWWGGSGSPIVFYTGAEGNGVDSIFTHSGWVMELAQNFSALVVFAEMRFFGKSMPFGEQGSFEHSPTRLGLLSIEQAIADYATLIHFIRQEYSAEMSPLISLGGSLAGTLTTFLRLKYPNDVDMGLASSAPILGYPGLTDEFGWYRVATDAFDRQVPGCSQRVRQGFSDLLAASPAEVTQAFNTCSPASEWTAASLSSQLTSQLSAMGESAYPFSISPIVAACDAMAGRSGPGIFKPLLVQDGGCLPIDGSDNGASTAAEAWYYIACTDIVHPIASNNITDMFPPSNATSSNEWCNSEFGVVPRPHWMPESMGMDNLEKFASMTSRIIFSSGELDPWSAQSVRQDLSETLIAINISDGSHHSDLGGTPNPFPTPEDSATLVAAREREVSILRQWVAEVARERAERLQNVLV